MRCIGVLSAMDFLRLLDKPENKSARPKEPLPVTCSFQKKHRRPDGKEVVLCTLMPGVCPLQRTEKVPGEADNVVCREPHCVLTDWQMVDVEQLPGDEVRHYMTADPVTVHETTGIRGLAQRMVDAHIHRLIVVDDEQQPVGIVTSTDLLAALAFSEEEVAVG
jgi:CBS domain-containing protein